MANDLSVLSAWIGQLNEHFDARQRRVLTRKISQAVKKTGQNVSVISKIPMEQDLPQDVTTIAIVGRCFAMPLEC